MSAADFAPYQPPPDERQQALLASAAASSSSQGAGNGRPKTGSLPGEHRNTSAASPYDVSGGEKRHIAAPQPYVSDRRDSLDSDYDARYATESYQSSVPQQREPLLAPGRPSGIGQTSGGGGVLPTWAPQPQRHQVQQVFGAAGSADHLNYSTSQGWNLPNLCFAAWGLAPFTSVALLIYETENDLVRFHAYQAGMLGVGSILLLWILRTWFGWYTFSIIVGMALLGYSWVCGSNAANAAPTLARSPYLPVLGPLAEQWVSDE